MTDEQKKWLDELITNKREFKKKAEIERVKTQMSTEIENFEQLYKFSNTEESKLISKFINSLPYCRPACVDLESFSAKRRYFPSNVDERNIWICFLLGDEELFKIFVKGSMVDFFNDFVEWELYSPYLLLLYNDFSGFVFIDDNRKMTEVIL